MPEMWHTMRSHVFLPGDLEVTKMRHPTDVERTVKIRRRIQRKRYLNGKSVYKVEKTVLTIPARFRNMIKPFIDKELKIDVRQEGGHLIIDAKPLENTRENV